MTQNFQQQQPVQPPAQPVEVPTTSPFAIDEVQIPSNSTTNFEQPVGAGWNQQQTQPQPQVQPQQTDGFSPGQMQQLEAMLAKLVPTTPVNQGIVPGAPGAVVPTTQTAPEVSTPEFTQLAEQFKRMLGVDLKEAVQQIQQVQATQVMEQTNNQLREHWNLDQRGLTQRYQEIAKAATDVSPEQVAKYDALGADGVILFYERYVAPNVPKKMPVFDRGTSFVPRGNETFNVDKARASIASGNAAQNWGDILQAYAQSQN